LNYRAKFTPILKGRPGPLFLAMFILIMTIGQVVVSDSNPPHGKTQEHYQVVMSDLELEVEIDGGFALTRMRQTFMNRTDGNKSGSLILRLPDNAMIERVGVWEEGQFLDARIEDIRRKWSPFGQSFQGGKP
jgi:hypothetical protein